VDGFFGWVIGCQGSDREGGGCGAEAEEVTTGEGEGVRFHIRVRVDVGGGYTESGFRTTGNWGWLGWVYDYELDRLVGAVTLPRDADGSAIQD
jgi:hypothetical protein